MNILIIDSMPELFGGSGEALLRFSKENRRHRLCLCRELSALGANVLLVRACPRKREESSAFCYREEEGVFEMLVPVPKRKKRPIPIKEMMTFNKVLLANAESLAGLFKPDCVINADSLCLSVFAAEKIAETAKAPLVTESLCNPKQLLLLSGAKHPFDPVLKIISRAFAAAQKRSVAVAALYPGAKKDIKNAKRLYPMAFPHNSAKAPPPKAAEKREALASFKEGGGFCLCCPFALEKGYPVCELISACGELGEKFALVFIGGGAQKAAYQKYAVGKGITNCFFIDETEEKDLPFVLSGANAVFLAENSVLKGCAAEQRLFLLSMEAGVPVLAMAENYADFFRESGGAVIIKPKNRESLRLGLQTMLEMSTVDMETLGTCSKTFANKYTYQKYSEDLLEIIKET